MTIQQNTDVQRRSDINFDTVLHTLRALVPDRHVSHLESLHIAEQQADLLRDILHITTDTFPVDLIEKIPFVSITPVHELPVSGIAFWGDHTWKIHIRAEEPLSRRRFNTLHEFKHVIDHPNLGRLYDGRPHVAAGERELVADHFAACVLMPADQLRRASLETVDRCTLAGRFHVDHTQLGHRLDDLDLTPIAPEQLSIYVTERRIT